LCVKMPVNCQFCASKTKTKKLSMKNHPFVTLRSWLLVCLIVAVSSSACQEDQTKTNAIARQKGSAVVELPDLPDNAKQTEVDINDLNFWTEGAYFYVVGLVDDRSNQWSRIWVKIQLLDENDEVLKFDGGKEIVVPTFSDALPPRGRTSFFAGFPLAKINGKPAKVVFTDAFSMPVDPGAILISSSVGGVMILTQAKPGDSTATFEKGWAVSGIVENPLPDYTVDSLRGEWLVYGSDEKLYMSVLVVGQGDNPSLMQERPGSLFPLEKIRVGGSLLYENMPKMLDSVRIGRVELHVFDSRVFKNK